MPKIKNATYLAHLQKGKPTRMEVLNSESRRKENGLDKH